MEDKNYYEEVKKLLDKHHAEYKTEKQRDDFIHEIIALMLN